MKSTGDRFLEYLDKLESNDQSSEEKVMQNYEEEFEKVETLSQTMISMI